MEGFPSQQYVACCLLVNSPQNWNGKSCDIVEFSKLSIYVAKNIVK